MEGRRMDARKVVLVHDWLTGYRGGEKCLDHLCRRWPDAPLLTLLHVPGSTTPEIENRPIIPSFLQRWPGSARYYRYLLPLLPLAARWKTPPCDLVVSLSHCVAKGATPPPGVPHVCYCFTPMRYAWHMREAYFGGGRLRRVPSAIVGRLLAWLRHWDRSTAARVTHFIAISETVRVRIAECYGRDSVVIYPPVDTEFYTPSYEPREDFYLVVSAFAPYKRIDLAVAACRDLRRKLVVIGAGQDERRLRALGGSQVEFLGWQPDETIRQCLRRCRALLFPGEEDFGIVPVEAQACGAPVIAFGRGGAAETVVAPMGRADPTGLLFREQTVECLKESIAWFERHFSDFDPRAGRRQALHFNPRRFDAEFDRFLQVLEVPAVAPMPRAA
jgi:glycosyltransferase involved in cell wall biosynthesis